MNEAPLKRYAWLSILTAVATILLKAVAWQLTGSVGLLSDALESVVNLAGAMMALAMISLAAQPPDSDHAYGHGKAEYFSAGFEGLLILVAAIAIGATALMRLFDPQPLEQVGAGLAVSVAASLLNLVTALILRVAGRRYRSLTLEADAHHLLTDVWTSAGVIAGLAAVSLSGWLWLDPLIALLVAGNILRIAGKLLHNSAQGLMDRALPEADMALLQGVFDRHRARGIEFHALRTRESGARRFIDFHVLVPGHWSVQCGHERVEEIEAEIRQILPQSTILTHLEPIEDPLSLADIALDR